MKIGRGSQSDRDRDRESGYVESQQKSNSNRNVPLYTGIYQVIKLYTPASITHHVVSKIFLHEIFVKKNEVFFVAGKKFFFCENKNFLHFCWKKINFSEKKNITPHVFFEILEKFLLKNIMGGGV